MLHWQDGLVWLGPEPDPVDVLDLRKQNASGWPPVTRGLLTTLDGQQVLL